MARIISGEKMQIIKPSRIKAGDTIGIIGPSYPYAQKLEKRYLRALGKIKDLGFRIKEGNFVKTKQGFRTGSGKERAEDINQMFRDPEVKAIFAVNGGSVASEVLPYLDYSLIRKNPKIIMGYSDINCILLAIYAKSGLVTFSGPMIVPQFGEFPSILNYTLNSMQAILQKDSAGLKIIASDQWTDEFLDSLKNEDLKPRRMQENLGYISVKEGVAEGKVVSSNLRILCSLLGTPYAPDLEGSILIIEDLSVGTDEVERNLTHLENAGILKKINGLIVGRIRELKEKEGVSLKEVLEYSLKEYNFPVIMGFDFGHTDPFTTLPNGVMARLDADKKTIILLETAAV